MEEGSLRMCLDKRVPARPILLCHDGNACFTRSIPCPAVSEFSVLPRIPDPPPQAKSPRRYGVAGFRPVEVNVMPEAGLGCGAGHTGVDRDRVPGMKIEYRRTLVTLVDTRDAPTRHAVGQEAEIPSAACEWLRPIQRTVVTGISKGARWRQDKENAANPACRSGRAEPDRCWSCIGYMPRFQQAVMRPEIALADGEAGRPIASPGHRRYPRARPWRVSRRRKISRDCSLARAWP